MTDIFDLENIEDVPKRLKSRISSCRMSADSEKLVSLFEMKNILSIDEILIGLFRKFRIEKNRGWVSSTVYNLSRRNVLKMKGRGIYELANRGEGER